MRRFFGLAMVVLAVALLTVGCAAEAQEAPQKPNILVVLTDDQPYYTTAQMPKLRSGLAEQGVSFSRAFLVDPLCCPTRATVLTGKYTHNHHIISNALPGGGAQKFRQNGLEQDTVATRLAAEGYATGLFGKYMNGYDGTWVPPGWERWFAFSGDINREISYDVKDQGEVRTFSRESWHETDLVADRAARFIEGHQDAPWFALVAPHAPHGPYGGSYVPDRHSHAFDGARRGSAEVPSFDEADISDKPFDAPHLSSDEKRDIQEAYEGKLEALQAVDDLVGQLLGKLQETGQLDDTYVVYLTDNGYLLGEHRLTAKGQPYEESIRTPLFVRGPGVPVGETRGQLAADVDLAPTIAGWAGTDASGYDGRSLAPLLSDNPTQQWRKALLIEHFTEEVGAAFSGVRTERYAYFERARTGKRELYDLEADPYQLQSIHATAPGALVTDLRGRLEALRGCSGEECRTAEVTTGATADTTAPTVILVAPKGKRVSPGANATATFSEGMNPATINRSTFTLKRGARPVGALVSYDAASRRAMLNPNRRLVRGATYTATVSSGAKDQAGNALVARSWRFTVRR